VFVNLLKSNGLAKELHKILAVTIHWLVKRGEKTETSFPVEVHEV
jgi:hypothetical protein